MQQEPYISGVHQYNHKGPDVFILQGRGGRRRELLSWNEEEELLEELRERGERGAIVIARTIREYAAKKLGTEVSKDYAYDLLHRLMDGGKLNPGHAIPRAIQKHRKSLKKLPEIVASLRSNLCGGRHTPAESVFSRRGTLWPYE